MGLLSASKGIIEFSGLLVKVGLSDRGLKEVWGYLLHERCLWRAQGFGQKSEESQLCLSMAVGLSNRVKRSFQHSICLAIEMCVFPRYLQLLGTVVEGEPTPVYELLFSFL